jgi:hypothetical protein
LRNEAISTHRALSGPRLLRCRSWLEIHRFGREKIFPANRSGREIAGKLPGDPDIIERFRATGPGWQSRINAALREYLDRQ